MSKLIFFLYSFKLFDLILFIRDNILIKMTPQYKHIFVRNLELAESINIGGGNDKISLEVLAKEWIESLVRNGSLARNRISSKTEIADAMLKNDYSSGIDDRIDSIIRELKDKGVGNYVDELLILLGRKFANNAHFVQESEDVADDSHDDDETVMETVPAAQESHPHTTEKNSLTPQMTQSTQRVRDSRRHGSFDVPIRKDLARLRGKEKLELLKQIEKEVSEMPEGRKLTGAMRSFSTQCLLPILRCLRNHCNHSEEVFLHKWGANFVHTKFGSRKCNGKANDCTGISTERLE